MKMWNKCFAILPVATMLMVVALAVRGHEGKKHPSPTPSPQSEAAMETAPANSAETTPEATPEAMGEITDFPNYHPLVVHFPIVLLIIATVFQAVSFFLYGKEFGVAALLLLAAGVVSVWLASNTFHGHAGELPERIKALFEEHERMADFTLWFSAAALGVKLVSQFVTGRKWWSEAVVFVLLAGAAIAVSIAGHHGAQLVHMEGVGPKGNYLEKHEH